MFEVPVGRTEKAIRAAWQALDAFRDRLQQRGKEMLNALEDDDQAVVIVSRPYNGCDAAMNLNLPDKLRDLGVLAIPLDFLPLDLPALAQEFPRMYWKYGQKILAAARFIGPHPNLHAVYITNFGCGPDSFIAKFFGRLLGEPYLTIEVDQHSADVGAITRCEAFLDSFRSIRGEDRKRLRANETFFDVRRSGRPVKVYVPHMDDHNVVLAAMLRANGIDAEALPMSDRESAEIGRKFTTGKECYPCILTTGDIVKKTREPGFDPECSAFFMPEADGPCRFGQYHKCHRMILDDLGLEEVPLVVLGSGRGLRQPVGRLRRRTSTATAGT